MGEITYLQNPTQLIKSLLTLFYTHTRFLTKEIMNTRNSAMNVTRIAGRKIVNAKKVSRSQAVKKMWPELILRPQTDVLWRVLANDNWIRKHESTYPEYTSVAMVERGFGI